MTHSQRPTSPQPDLASAQKDVADLKADLAEAKMEITAVKHVLVGCVTTQEDIAKQYCCRIAQLREIETV